MTDPTPGQSPDGVSPVEPEMDVEPPPSAAEMLARLSALLAVPPTSSDTTLETLIEIAVNPDHPDPDHHTNLDQHANPDQRAEAEASQAPNVGQAQPLPIDSRLSFDEDESGIATFPGSYDAVLEAPPPADSDIAGDPAAVDHGSVQAGQASAAVADTPDAGPAEDPVDPGQVPSPATAGAGGDGPPPAADEAAAAAADPAVADTGVTEPAPPTSARSAAAAAWARRTAGNDTPRLAGRRERTSSSGLAELLAEAMVAFQETQPQRDLETAGAWAADARAVDPVAEPESSGRRRAAEPDNPLKGRHRSSEWAPADIDSG
ncbi:hypothetical protein [Alloactinosynnema sp. L-07]|uniref:hypothetical protein n=1 Tax=Alloactinosynnema sp. L-07 TaxID=1653480 RepID=UPI0012F97EFC|nr:hypothetical protein [Alloactinosynnema sp. L-07]